MEHLPSSDRVWVFILSLLIFMETFEVCAIINLLPIVAETDTSEERKIAKDTQQVLGSARLQGV